MIPIRDDIPARRYPIVTVMIIGVNVLVFLYQLALPQRALQDFVWRFAMVPARWEILGGDPGTILSVMGTTILTSMFLHAGFLHVIGNMWFLWIFGDNVEDRMGPFRFAVFYLLCGVLASLTHLLFNIDSRIPTVGASGAVAGVLGAYVVSYPFARIHTIIPLGFFFPIIELPALVMLGVWFLMQILSGTLSAGAAPEEAGGVAFWAHVGGFLAGMALIGVFAKEPVRRYRGQGNLPSWK